MTIEIDTEEVASELMEDRTFVAWLDEHIDERTPDECDVPEDVTRDYQLRDYVQVDHLASHMQDAFNDHDASWFGITGTSVDSGVLAEEARSMLESLPYGSESRCALGVAFEAAVLKIVRNVLQGQNLVTYEDGAPDGWIMDAVERVVPGAITARQRDIDAAEADPLVGKQVTCDAGLDVPHTYVPGECTNAQLAETVDPDPSDDGDPGASDSFVPDAVGVTMVREVLVLTMSGERDGAGAVSVWTDHRDELWEVRKVSYGSTRPYTVVLRTANKCDAFTQAFASTAWDVRCTESE